MHALRHLKYIWTWVGENGLVLGAWQDVEKNSRHQDNQLILHLRMWQRKRGKHIDLNQGTFYQWGNTRIIVFKINSRKENLRCRGLGTRRRLRSQLLLSRSWWQMRSSTRTNLWTWKCTHHPNCLNSLDGWSYLCKNKLEHENLTLFRENFITLKTKQIKVYSLSLVQQYKHMGNTK